MVALKVDREAVRARVEELVADHVPAMFAGHALVEELMLLIDQVIDQSYLVGVSDERVDQDLSLPPSTKISESKVRLRVKGRSRSAVDVDLPEEIQP